LLLNAPLADEIGRRGQAAIRERYTAELMAQRTLALYQRVLAGPNRSAAAVERTALAQP
jgi:hypothetical protein